MSRARVIAAAALFLALTVVKFVLPQRAEAFCGGLHSAMESGQELRAAMETGHEVDKEMGDVFFAAMNVCRLLGLDGEEIRLTPIEYKLLCLLSRNVGKVLTHKFITQSIWGNSLDSTTASLRVFMATLRKKLKDSPDGVQYIQTHVGIGYRMIRVEDKAE